MSCGKGENRKVGGHGDFTVDRSESGMLDVGWNFSWDDCGISDEEDTKVGEVISLVGLLDDIWSEVVLSGEENTWRKSGDTGYVWNFSGAVIDLSKEFWHFGLKDVAVADSDWNEDDWGSVWTERTFDLVKEDGGGDIINDGCDRHDYDNCDNDCSDNTSCNVSITNFENLMLPFLYRWKWFL